ncbi:hypothetical protein [Paenibacillus oleatilyticus]|uniref:Butirosin biosynthesis protein H N-terminal domain-containing protein n=1 Tax=Paenibacillus oleatilyticus TaxID=2594886 RepID=A0ABV4VA59_9BACL
MDKNEELYLACYQTLLMYYFRELKNTAIPIDYIYYNALEPTSRIYKGCFIEKKTRFDYENRVNLGDLALLNIFMKVIDGDGYDHLKPHILKLLDEGNEVFLFVDEYYLPYSLQYQNLHTHHSHMITGYEFSSDGMLVYHITDNVGAQIKNQQCMEICMEQAFNQTGKNYISYFELNEHKSASIDNSYFVVQMKESVLNYNDEYEIFRDFTSFTDEEWDRLLTRPEDLTFYSHAFGIMSGSRYCFLKALNRLNHSNITLDTNLTKFYEGAQVLTFLLGKAVFSRRLEREGFRKRCEELMSLNVEIIQELRRTLTR